LIPRDRRSFPLVIALHPRVTRHATAIAASSSAAASMNGAQTKVTYSFVYSKAIFSVSNPAGKPSEADLKEIKTGKVHKISFYNNTSSKYATPADYWSAQKPCSNCTLSTSTPSTGGTGEMLSVYENTTQAWLIWKHTADLFIVIQVSKPAAPQIQDVVKSVQVTATPA